MRKLSIVLSAGLLCSTVAPSSAFAAEAGEQAEDSGNLDAGVTAEEQQSDTDDSQASETDKTAPNAGTSDEEQSADTKADGAEATNQPEADETGDSSSSDKASSSEQNTSGSEAEQQEDDIDKPDGASDDHSDGDAAEQQPAADTETADETPSEASAPENRSASTMSVTEVTTSPTSKLGHLHSGALIYEKAGKESTAFKSADYLNAVYYIKEKAKADNELYYLISKQASSTKGTIGWVKKEDMSTHAHKGVDRETKEFVLNGNGDAFTKAWGGAKDHVYDLSDYKGETFTAHKTETVGHNTWYRGEFHGKRIFVHENFVTDVNVSSISKLGHLHSGASIYKTIGNESSAFNSDDYLNAVYYIKEQASLGNDIYYHISKQASSTKGTVGWVKKEDMSTHAHRAVDRKSKTVALTGSGNAYGKAWGGAKDHVYDLSHYKGHVFHVHKTETVGHNTWYRGDFNGKRIWVHESYVTKLDKSPTSKLGHLRSGSIISGPKGSFSGEDYENAVYYIKEKTQAGSRTYYLISQKPSSTKGTIGWVKASDMLTHPHKAKDRKSKTFFITNPGNAYEKAWGGAKDKVYDLSNYKGDIFHVHKTEKVGHNTWYRGDFKGKRIWIHEAFVAHENKSQYDMTLSDAVDQQMKKTNKTDKGTSSGFEKASRKDVAHYMNPDNFIGDFRGSLQFLELSQSAKLNVSEVNNSILKGKGVLDGKAQQFVEAGRKHHVNEVYLMSHALLETGNGASDLAAGIDVGLDDHDNPQLVTSDNKDDLTAIKTVHNLFGIKAHDNNAKESGAKYAYEQGWFSVDKAIMGGADYIDHGYIESGQSTLYQMRWDPEFADSHDHASYHQYATDVGWAYKQTRYMNKIYNLLDDYRLMYDVPQYK